ncbi:MAG: extracellular solute-binding protein, partial [Clostridia bacterium]|nr:extracellular solute-binding protein [Clostridia bacterium]
GKDAIKKIFAFTSLLALTTSAAACGLGGGGGGGNLEKGFWEELAATVQGGGSSSGGLGGGATGDVVINGDPTAATVYDGSKVTVKFYHTMGQKLKEVLNTWLPDFYAMYPNITVEHASYGDYPGLRDQIVTELNGGNSPNIAYCYPDHVALYNRTHLVATLDDYIASSEMGFTQAEVNKFVRGYYEEGRAYGDNKMYTLPYSKSTEVLYYNKTFFTQHNLTVPTTWDEMETVMQQIVEIDPTCVPLGYDSEANWFITMCEQLGTPYTSAVNGQKFLFDVDVNHKFVERLRMWYQNGLVTTEETYGSYTSDLFTETDEGEQRSYMCIGSSAGASYQCPDPVSVDDGNGGTKTEYPFEVGVAMIPQIDKNNPKVISQGPSLCMFKKANKQEMAATWLFMKFLTTNIGLQANFSAVSGYAPVITGLEADNPAYAQALAAADGNANLQTTCVKQCINQEIAMFVSPAFIGSSGARDQVGILMQNCFVNQPTEGQSSADFIKAEFEKAVAKLRYDHGA